MLYHLMIFCPSNQLNDFGLSGNVRHYYLSSSDDVCIVLCRLNHLSNLVYTIEKLDVSSVSDVLEDFQLKEV